MEKYIRFYEPQVNYKLLETLYAIQKDVNYIYDKCFKQFVDDIQNGKYKDIDLYTMSSDGAFNFIFSNELQTSLCKEANDTNPISIFCGSFNNGSYYSFNENKIQISLNRDAIEKFYKVRLSKKKNTTVERLILGEMSITKIKATIAHELAHWIDESKYSVISKIIKDEKDQEVIKKLMTLGYKDVDMTYFEIQAQIHGIKQLKNRHKKYWNIYTFEKLFELYPPLFNIATKLSSIYNDETLKIWIHFLYKRMNREHLLGNNMRLPFNLNKIFNENYTRI